jgi:hypothetical protein
MRGVMKNLVRNERGAALILALILLLIGGLISAALLGHMGSGILAGVVHERRTAELYAADAGVEDAIWKIQHPSEVDYLPCSPGSESKIYTITDVNGRNIQVTIEFVDWSTYKIISIAAIDDAGGTAAIDSSTAVEAYAVSVYGNYTDITNNVLTSQDTIDYPSHYILSYPEGHGPIEYYDGSWPALNSLSAWYWEDVKNGEKHYEDTTIDLEGVDRDLGPLYVRGKLTITNSGETHATLALRGTIYATGDVFIANTDLTIDMGGHAIFTESPSRNPPKHAFYVKTSALEGNPVIMKGPGVVAAIGDIYFEPTMETGLTDPIFIISVEGKTELKPNGAFYGAVAGSAEIELYPGSSVTYPENGFPDDLNWPGFDRGKIEYGIYSWEIIQQ